MVLQVSAGQVKSEEVEAFLKMGGALDIASVRKKPRVRAAHRRQLSNGCTRVSAASCMHCQPLLATHSDLGRQAGRRDMPRCTGAAGMDPRQRVAEHHGAGTAGHF